jgi:nicotinate-nucleotide adenylyltransferase
VPDGPTDRRAVGLLGGSFDPIHHGHLIVAQSALEALDLAELRLVPAREQPFKAGRHAAPATDRARMVALAIEGDPRLRVESIELERPGPSYTIDTLRALRAREPDRVFTLLIGADAAGDLAKWHEAPLLHTLAELVIFARAGMVIPSLPWPSRTITVPAVDISATAIRERIRVGLPVRYWVPDPVASYIRERGLYC